jgi:hypothetical protein
VYAEQQRSRERGGPEPLARGALYASQFPNSPGSFIKQDRRRLLRTNSRRDKTKKWGQRWERHPWRSPQDSSLSPCPSRMLFPSCLCLYNLALKPPCPSSLPPLPSTLCSPQSLSLSLSLLYLLACVSGAQSYLHSWLTGLSFCPECLAQTHLPLILANAFMR